MPVGKALDYDDGSSHNGWGSGDGGGGGDYHENNKNDSLPVIFIAQRGTYCFIKRPLTR